MDLCVELGDRIAILGPNGAGKSTLLRLIRGAEAPRRGRAEIAAANAVTEHYEQDQASPAPDTRMRPFFKFCLLVVRVVFHVVFSCACNVETFGEVLVAPGNYEQDPAPTAG